MKDYVKKIDARGIILRLFGCLAVLVVVSGCKHRGEPLSPDGMNRLTLGTVQSWLVDLAPQRAARYDVNWTYQTQQGAVRGQAALRVQPPDSMRFDYRGPFGRAGASVVVNDDVVWAEPEEEVELLMPVVPLFWAALGIPRDPSPGAQIIGLETDTERRWRYGENGDTLDYVVTRVPPYRLQASMRRLRDVIGLVEVTYDDTRMPVEAMLTFPQTATRFMFDVTKVDTTVTLSPDIWDRP